MSAKFRGKSLSTGEWVYSELNLRIDDSTWEGIANSLKLTRKDWKAVAARLQNLNIRTIGRFSGKVDKNGVEVYENDLLYDTIYGCKWLVEWCDGCETMGSVLYNDDDDNDDDDSGDYINEIVVGNIWAED